jgi:hypothetical protein
MHRDENFSVSTVFRSMVWVEGTICIESLLTWNRRPPRPKSSTELRSIHWSFRRAQNFSYSYVRNNLVRSISWQKQANQSGPFDFTPWSNWSVSVSWFPVLNYYICTRNWSFTLWQKICSGKVVESMNLTLTARLNHNTSDSADDSVILRINT